MGGSPDSATARALAGRGAEGGGRHFRRSFFTTALFSFLFHLSPAPVLLEGFVLVGSGSSSGFSSRSLGGRSRGSPHFPVIPAEKSARGERSGRNNFHPPPPHPFAARNGGDKYRAGGRSRHSPGQVRRPAGTCCWTGAERFPAGRDGMGHGETPTCWRVAGQRGLPEGVAEAAGTGAVWSCPLPRPVPPPQQLFSALSLLHFIMDLTKVPPPHCAPPPGSPRHGRPSSPPVHPPH